MTEDTEKRIEEIREQFCKPTWGNYQNIHKLNDADLGILLSAIDLLKKYGERKQNALDIACDEIKARGIKYERIDQELKDAINKIDQVTMALKFYDDPDTREGDVCKEMLKILNGNIINARN